MIMEPATWCSIGTTNHFQARNIDRDRERHRIVAVGLQHIPGGKDDHLIGVGQYRCVDFRATYHNAVRTFLNDAYVVVWMRLLRRSQAAVAFDVGLRHRQDQIVLRTMLVKLAYPAEIIG